MTTNWPPGAIEATSVCVVFSSAVIPHSTAYGTVSAVPEAVVCEVSTIDTISGANESTVSSVFTG
jgi:hypothetical protein